MAGLGIGVAAASRPYPGETENGDAWVANCQGDTCRIAVIDGLGHGPLAALASTAAVEALQSQPALPPVQALELCHHALAGTRGAAISIATVDLAAAKVTFAGIGNVDGQLWQRGRAQRFSPDRGIVGVTHRSLHALTIPLDHDWFLLLHSDGISARFDPDSVSEAIKRDPQAVAEQILAQWGRERDDATIVAACAQHMEATGTR